MIKVYVLQGITLLASVFMLAGCANTNGRNMSMAVQSVDYLNPNEHNLPEPVTLTIFELKLPNKFKQANYNALIFNSMPTLGSDLIDKENIIIRPGEQKHYAMNLSDDVKYIGFIAGYRSINQSTWKKVIAVPVVKSKKFNIVDPNQTMPVNIRMQSNEMVISQPSSQRHLL